MEPDGPTLGKFDENIEFIEYKPFGQGLVMAVLDVNSLVAHIDELWVFMSSSEKDILVINEAKLNFSVENRELKHATFLSHGRQPEVNISHGRTAVSPRFSNYSSL